MPGMVRDGDSIASHVPPDAPADFIRRDGASVAPSLEQARHEPVSFRAIGEHEDDIGGRRVEFEARFRAPHPAESNLAHGGVLTQPGRAGGSRRVVDDGQVVHLGRISGRA